MTPHGVEAVVGTKRVVQRLDQLGRRQAADDWAMTPDRPDVALAALQRAELAARRFGWSIRLAEVRPDLLEPIGLVGLRTDLVG